MSKKIYKSRAKVGSDMTISSFNKPEPSHQMRIKKHLTNDNFSKSSSTWVKRHLNDAYVQMAQQEGYLARSAYKIIEINEKFGIFKYARNVLELGAAPGAWSQVVLEKTHAKITAIDLLDIDLEHKRLFKIKGDFNDSNNQDIMAEQGLYDVILSDMLPNLSGDQDADTGRISLLTEGVLQFCMDMNSDSAAQQHLLLKTGGHFVCKIFGNQEVPINRLRKLFDKVSFFKPQACNKSSKEIYLVCKEFL